MPAVWLKWCRTSTTCGMSSVWLEWIQQGPLDACRQYASSGNEKYDVRHVDSMPQEVPKNDHLRHVVNMAQVVLRKCNLRHVPSMPQVAPNNFASRSSSEALTYTRPVCRFRGRADFQSGAAPLASGEREGRSRAYSILPPSGSQGELYLQTWFSKESDQKPNG